MPITINGSGTVTGISVGGLPDGIVDTDMLANNAVTTAKSTGFATTNGITHFDRWLLTSSFAGEKNPVDTNLARASMAGVGLIGDAMTESSGIFTFPATGIWRIYTQREVYLNDDDREIRIIIITTQNNWTTDYNATENSTHVTRSESSNTHASQTASCTFDVTDTSQCKVKFRFLCNDNNTNTIGESGKHRTYFEFMRIGDT